MKNKRVKIRFDDRFRKIESQHRRCWMQIASIYKSIADLQHEICTRCVDSSELEGLYLSLDNFTLLPSESIDLIQNGDVIDVRRKLGASKAAKKRMRIKHSKTISKPDSSSSAVQLVESKKQTTTSEKKSLTPPSYTTKKPKRP